MGVTAALIIAAGTAVAAGASAYSSHEAGKSSAKAGAAANAQYRSDGEKQASTLDKYRKLLSMPGMMNLEAVKANIANLPDIKRLTGQVNTFNQSELTRMLSGVLPGYQGSVNRAMKNTASWIRGEVPSDVSAAIRDRTAEKSLNFGFAGSASGKALTARDLGTTSMNLMEQGANSLQRWLQTAQSYLMPRPFDPTAFFVSPDQQMRGIEDAARIAGQQADMRLGNSNKGTEQNLAGQAAAIKGEQQMYQAIGQGVSSIAGTGAGVVAQQNGAGYQNYLNRPNAAVPQFVSSPNGMDYVYQTGGGWTPQARV